jgi:hypothetical protein
MPLINFTPANWYWIVAGSTAQVYSSGVGDYVPVSDATYQSWLAAGNMPTKIDTEQNLTDVLLAAGEPGVPTTPSPSSSAADQHFSNIPLAVQRWAFAVDNRVRVVEGQPMRTAAQFKSYVKGLL